MAGNGLVGPTRWSPLSSIFEILAPIVLISTLVLGRGLHSFTLELNLRTFRTHSLVQLGYEGEANSWS